MKTIMTQSIHLYDVVIEPCEEGGFFATCPELQGCHAEGETYGEVIDTMKSVIEEHLSVRKEKGEPVAGFDVTNRKDIRFHVPLPVGI